MSTNDFYDLLDSTKKEANKTPEQRQYERISKGDTANTADNMMGNIGKYFFGIEDRALIESPYKPSIKSNKKYYKWDEKLKRQVEDKDVQIKYHTRSGMKNDVFNDLTSDSVMENYNHDNSFEDIFKGLKSDGKDRKHNADKAFPQNAIGYKGMYNVKHGTMKGQMNLGRYKVDAGEDSKGRYISFIDNYDWNGLEDNKFPEYNPNIIRFYDRIYENEWDYFMKKNKKKNK